LTQAGILVLLPPFILPIPFLGLLADIQLLDNIPLRDPSHLFTTPLYHSSNHAIFWPDLSKDHPSNSIWRLVGEPCTNDLWTFETGQIVIDKAGNDGLNLAALIIAAEMQGDRDFWFHMSGGDKDTFRWAWRILGLDFGMAPRWMSTLGIRNDYDGGKFCGQ
jgi:alpha 1,2-mannosyltransferase